MAAGVLSADVGMGGALHHGDGMIGLSTVEAQLFMSPPLEFSKTGTTNLHGFWCPRNGIQTGRIEVPIVVLDQVV